MLGATLITGTPLQSQPAPLRLERAEARSSTGFTDVVGVAELRDRSIIAVDLRERRIARVDFASRTATNVARPGEGPNDFTGTFALLPWTGDTILVYGRRDFLKIAPSGALAGKLALVEGPFGNRGTGVPRFADDAGRIYYELPEPLVRRADGMLAPQLRYTVARFNPRTGATDTIGSLQTRDPSGPFVSFWRPFPARDAFAALRNGQLLILRAADYAIDVYGPSGNRTSTTRLPATLLPVTVADRDAYRDEMLLRPKGTATMTGPDVRTLKGADRDLAREKVGIPDAAFPKMQPVFTEDRATLVDPLGRVWVRRSFRAGETDRTYDVLSPAGQLLRRFIVPDRGRVVGFGPGVVYIVRLDDDDVEWIERHSMPKS